MAGSRRSTAPPGRTWSIVGLVSGVAAFLLIPILFGPLGIIFGILGYRKGDRNLGRIAMIVSAVGLVVGIILAVIALFFVQPQPVQP